MSGVPTVISFHGVDAVYHDEERRMMRELVKSGAAISEVETVHQIIAEFGGTLVEGGGVLRASEAGQEPEGETSACASPSTSVVHMTDGALSESGNTPVRAVPPRPGPPGSESIPTGHGEFSIPDRVIEQMKASR